MNTIKCSRPVVNINDSLNIFDTSKTDESDLDI